VTKREMGDDFYSIYDANILKDIIYFIIFLSNVKEKVYPKVFWVFKNGQKKCPKMKRGETVWKKQHLLLKCKISMRSPKK
jgi:hypothetical protein